MKCSCVRCGGHIEYEAASAGLEIACPHCKQLTRLAAYSGGPATTPPPPPPVVSQNKFPGWAIVLIVCGALVVALPVMGLLAAIAIPNFIKARQMSQQMACVSNLRTIEGAKATWAAEMHKMPTDIPSESELFGPTLYIKQKPTCPAAGTYTLNSVGTKATCSIAGHTL